MKFDIALLMLVFAIFTAILLILAIYAFLFLNILIASLCYYVVFYFVGKFGDPLTTKFCMAIGLLLLIFTIFLFYAADFYSVLWPFVTYTFLEMVIHSGNALVILSVYPDIFQSFSSKLEFSILAAFVIRFAR